MKWKLSEGEAARPRHQPTQHVHLRSLLSTSGTIILLLVHWRGFTLRTGNGCKRGRRGWMVGHARMDGSSGGKARTVALSLMMAQLNERPTECWVITFPQSGTIANSFVIAFNFPILSIYLQFGSRWICKIWLSGKVSECGKSNCIIFLGLNF